MTQCERVLDYLKDHGAITPLEAQTELGIMRLGARIWDFEAAGRFDQKGNGKGKEPIRESDTLRPL